ncbi:hypothetical protein N864_20575 [Intrasporangium chromatireducens Q5-1]|uniref:Hemerythrin-like domain-containing protein n=1 Tax=Intrasporangium chromatireducens Q5-1 TaxID=584657 RepID=W9GJY3_9MICO|nr:hypothetical protein [Intrasporangium chromatireducens]EWT06536.1 hypothetical protein N864_20575 [Intrasporangium chromatireducens Q5-1]
MATTVQARIWPDQVRLPGQLGAPAGPLDLRVPYAVHHAARADLERFGGAVRRTPAAEVAVWRALAERWRVLVMAVRHEVAAEAAALWPLVRERGAAVDRVAVHELRHEQEAAHKDLERCRFALDALAQRGADPVDHRGADPAQTQVVTLQERAAERVRRCLSLKERVLFVAVQRVLEPAEWRAAERAHFRVGVAPEAVDHVLWLTDGLPGPLRRDVFRRLGHMEQLMWTLGRAPYRRRDAVAFRYLE